VSTSSSPALVLTGSRCAVAEKRGISPVYRGWNAGSRIEKAKGDGHGRYDNKVRVFEQGRVCAEDGCNTVLSLYNRRLLCSIHESLRHRYGGPRSLH